jgi:NTP pyrophosphatase (non-canonical NTP hydrolase)
MDEQDRVARFVAAHGLTCPPAYRLLDLAAEVGELAADANDASDYGADPDALDVNRDEVGDALFALLALCDDLDIDAGTALEESLSKYESRLDERGDAGSA